MNKHLAKKEDAKRNVKRVQVYEKKNNMYTIMKVNGERYLINTMVSDLSQDKACEAILRDFPEDADVSFEVPDEQDFM